MSNVRFCLICNYISRIDESLRNEFVCVRFNQLPPVEIYRFLRHIADTEQVTITDLEIQSVQQLHKSDVRSMINFLQLHQQDGIPFRSFVIVDDIWDELSMKIKNTTTTSNTADVKKWIIWVSRQYHMDIVALTTQYFTYLVKKACSGAYDITSDDLATMHKIIHTEADTDPDIVLDFFIQSCIQMMV